ncbi:hypothetical protein [Mammaliicoccus sciuri]|uniref:hypothetical protein n=1 Tax=Mammaliicoccus sciuri TaxID=1296 RepID=UPI003F5583EC
MDERIRGRIFIDGLELKDINQVFQRLFKINDQYGEQLEKDDWNLILEHTKQASMLIPPMSEQSDANETYYVVERFDRYVDGVFTVYANDVAYEKQLTTTKSLLDCDRYNTYEEAQEFANKYNCNVRKVIVKVEE